MTTLEIAVPDDVVDDLALSTNALTMLAREALFVRLYDRGELSSGKAARLLGVSRREFLDLLGQYGVSSFDDEVDFAAETQHGR